ncbi:MAG: carboxypeptidase regulatory-like domain-containing protein [Vicinamibacterales bacterium]
MLRHLSMRVAAVVLALLVPVLASAQQNATVVGTVVDESKAVLPGVTVTATDLATGRVITAVTNERGEYRLQNVPAGKYSISAELAGFGTVKVPEIELLVGQNASVPLQLKVASLEETVTVSGEAPLVDIRSSQVAGNVDRRQMEELPLAGRNWMELSLQVKGITANAVDNRPGVGDDSAFQLNLDGQQITNKVASSGFGQPKFSREAIAEFQIVTNLFDITQGRSTGIQVQAISKSGSNKMAGSVYGYFRDDKLNSADFVAKRVLPYQNQQTGGSFGGPLVKDKWHFFGSYEYEREPNTVFFAPVNLPGQSFSHPDKQVNNSALGRVDQNLTDKSHMSYRYSIWDFDRPYDKQAEHPTQSAARTRHADNFLVSWSHVRSSSMVEELKVGYNSFGWTNGLAIDSLRTQAPPGWLGTGTPSFNFINGTIGPPQNFPQEFKQRMVTARYDLTWTRSSHEFKIGGEFLGWKDTGEWHLGERGVFNFRANPTDLDRRFPASAVDNPAAWDITGLDSLASNFLQNTGNWAVDIPRPTYAIWLGDNWRVNNSLTINAGLRYDLDQGATAPPDVNNQTVFKPLNGPLFKSDIHDNNNVSPRVGFAWNVGGKSDLVIRGGTGLYYGTIISNVTFSQQSFGNRIIVNSFANDGQPGWFLNPTRNYTAAQIQSGAVPQAPRVIAHDFEFPVDWQSSIGFQKQITSVLGFEMDLTHWKEYNRSRARDINLVADPATGYPAVGAVADPAWGPVLWLESHGKADYLALANGITRRFANKFQAGINYTLMLYAHDNQPTSSFGPNADNPLNIDDASEWAQSQEFQRSTLRFNGIWAPGWGITLSGAYQYGSGNYYSTSVGGNPFSKSRAALGLTNRLYVGTAPLVVNTALAGDRYEGPTTLNSGDRVPRNALKGDAIHKVDARITKTIKVGGIQLQGVAEVFNIFNHANFGAYNAVVSSATFGAPQQNNSNAYRPRTGQLAFRIQF